MGLRAPEEIRHIGVEEPVDFLDGPALIEVAIALDGRGDRVLQLGLTRLCVIPTHTLGISCNRAHPCAFLSIFNALTCASGVAQRLHSGCRLSIYRNPVQPRLHTITAWNI